MANEKRLIDANKVINSMQKCLDEEPNKKGSVAYFAFESIIECLKLEPTVDAVEVKHGRWERVEEFEFISGEYVTTGYHCDKCGFYYKKKSNYCPNCGAKMDGDGNG